MSQIGPTWVATHNMLQLHNVPRVETRACHIHRQSQGHYVAAKSTEIVDTCLLHPPLFSELPAKETGGQARVTSAVLMDVAKSSFGILSVTKDYEQVCNMGSFYWMERWLLPKSAVPKPACNHMVRSTPAGNGHQTSTFLVLNLVKGSR